MRTYRWLSVIGALGLTMLSSACGSSGEDRHSDHKQTRQLQTEQTPTRHLQTKSLQTKQLQTPNQSTYQMKAVNNPAAAQRSAAIQRVINTGMKYRGTPYEFGSNRSTTRTFDCSDFVKHAYAEGAGIKLPADSRQQGMYVRNKGTANTNWRALRAGDVMFFSSPGVKITGTNRYRVRITHDGIYLGDGRILHTYSRESGGVRIDSIAGSQWERRFLFGGSVIR